MFGIEIIDASLLPALIVAVFAGLISFLSPCVLPIVPPYLAYMSGVALTDLNDKRKHRKIVLTALFFVLGLSTVFLILGFSASAIGAIFFDYQSLLNTLAGLVIMLFGLHFLNINPCIGPQLGAILSLAASNGSILKGTILLGFYAIGLGIPFLLFAIFINRMDGLLKILKKYFDVIERIMGLMLWTVGLLMLTGGFSSISFWLLETFPSLGSLG
ncbi:MAG: cytochrome c biogenesis protein CcdA [Rhodobacteraceae bacterium]|nr:cytochrome c biogenesis protein CcdA [Paracoccaceae bacterium]